MRHGNAVMRRSRDAGSLPLNSGRSALCEGPYLVKCRHGSVAGEGGEQRAMRPAQLDGFSGVFAVEQAVDEAGGEAITAADAIENVEFGGRRGIRVAVDPGDGAPAMAIGGMHFAQGGGDSLHMRKFLDDVVDHAEKDAGIELGFRMELGAGNAEALLQILLVADQHIDVLNDAADGFDGALAAAPDIPELLAEVEIE